MLLFCFLQNLGVTSGASEQDLVHSGLEDTMIESYANVRSISKLKVKI